MVKSACRVFNQINICVHPPLSAFICVKVIFTYFPASLVSPCALWFNLYFPYF
jgi:hypothetical protein